MNYTNNNHRFFNKQSSPISNSNSFNLERYKTFNKSFNSPFKLSLEIPKYYNNEEDKLKEKCWESLTNLIIYNYLKKGTKINNFGTFTFINSNHNNLNSIQNKTKNDIPIFLINSNFINNIKSGIYDDKKGLIEFSNKNYSINNNIEVIDIDYKRISKEINIPKEKIEKIIMSIIRDIKEKIKGEIFNAKKMDGLGIFLKRGNIF